MIDDGACAAILQGGRSLLPIGVVGVRGAFDEGALVSVRDVRGEEVARGLVNYSSRQLEHMKGRSTQAIETELGHKLHYDEVIHRDNLVVTYAGGNSLAAGTK